ncbi:MULTISPECIES: hypothetical protein [unclassified Paraburkholderia]|uniref:hypothetical protein n=1 Tax=unclassified Paraburkholderia TaxID=2615204 RepID=UPI0017DC6F5F|nr:MULTISPECIES: hypothetical protein [unclassified Paraburkholderia]MBB5446462.1 hypothetical protein [Paraburkholderia sp. WSM4177]MBB5486956.1 hypothetical protein [Paraburkholderia sp. WSM4180]
MAINLARRFETQLALDPSNLRSTLLQTASQQNQFIVRQNRHSEGMSVKDHPAMEWQGHGIEILGAALAGKR